MRLLACLALLLAVATSSPAALDSSLARVIAAERQRPRAPLHDRAAFLQRDEMVDVQLAPDGSAVAYLRTRDKGNSLWIVPTAGGEPRRLLRHTEASAVRWSANSRFLFVQSDRQLFALGLRGDAGGGVMSLLGGEQQREVMGVDPFDPAAMIVRDTLGEKSSPSYRLLRLRPSKRPELLLESRDLIADVSIAPSGRPAFARLTRADHHAILALQSGGKSREMKRCVNLERCAFVSSPDKSTLIMTSDIGSDLRRLVRMDLAGSIAPLHADPTGRYDLEEAVVEPGSGRPLFAYYRSGPAANYALDPAASAAMRTVAGALGHEAFDIVPASAKSRWWLVRESGDRLAAPAWHLFDRRAGQLRHLLTDAHRPRQALDPSTLSRRTAFSWRASDGMLLHGFLTVPPGIDPERAPLVVMVHGGPWSNVGPGYATSAQFLANRGYIVFEPNFRGSTGHGRRYMLAGKTDFANGRVQRDIDEGARFLLAAGIGDSSRVAITGTSFGGYSTLSAVTFSPELYKVGVAVVPPPDFGWVMRWQAARQDAERLPGIRLGTSLRMMAIDPADAAIVRALSARSPRAHSHRLSRPVLMIAGAKDGQVPLRSVTSYAAQLKAAGKDVSLFVDPEAGHRISTDSARATYLYLLETMLAKHLGAGSVAPPSGEVRQSLARNLRLRGSAFRS